MKQTYQFWFFSFIEFHDGFLIQILYFKLSKQKKKNNNKICIHILSAKPNPSNRLKAIMSNQNVNNPIKISFFLSLSLFQRPKFYISKCELLFESQQIFYPCKFVYKSYWWYHYNFSFSQHFCERWWEMVMQIFFCRKKSSPSIKINRKTKNKIKQTVKICSNMADGRGHSFGMVSIFSIYTYIPGKTNFSKTVQWKSKLCSWISVWQHC